MTSNGQQVDGSSLGLVEPSPVATAQGPASRLEAFVAGLAPSPFALVEEPADRQEPRILAWGLQVDDRAYVVGHDGELLGSFSSADVAHRVFSHVGTTVRLVWCFPG